MSKPFTFPKMPPKLPDRIPCSQCDCSNKVLPFDSNFAAGFRIGYSWCSCCRDHHVHVAAFKSEAYEMALDYAGVWFPRTPDTVQLERVASDGALVPVH